MFSEMKLLTETDAEYHSKSKSGDVMSSHLLLEFADNPYKYYLLTKGILPFPDSQAFSFGRALHCYVLQGMMAFNDSYIVSDGVINEKTGKPYGKETKVYAEWLAQQNPACEIISNADYDKIRAMDNAVHAHKEAAELLKDAVCEKVLRATVFDVPCQAKFDAVGNTMLTADVQHIVDLKTCADIGDFEHDIYKYRYDYQCAFYRMVFKAVFGFTPDFYFIAVEKKEPFTVGVWQLVGDLVAEAEDSVRDILLDYKEAKESGNWVTGYEFIKALSAKRSKR